MTLFNPRTQRAVLLNETATAVWRLSDGTRDSEDIVAILAEKYAQGPEAIRTQVLNAIAQLRGEALLQDAAEAG